MRDKHQLWPAEEAPLRVVMALTVARQETLSTAMAGVAVSYYDARNEQYPLDACYPPTLLVPEERCVAR
eukprot:15449778-Alexandrium_andersonii.AAC.1